MSSALSGLRVLDISSFLAAPQIATVLADFGADVIKIEPPHGEALRKIGAQRDGTRTIICDITGQPITASVYMRKTLRPGDTLNGPALILEPQTTTFVSRDFRASVDANDTLVLNREERGE